MNSGTSKTCYLYRLMLTFADKVYLQRYDKYDKLSNVSLYYRRKIKKRHTVAINLK